MIENLGIEKVLVLPRPGKEMKEKPEKGKEEEIIIHRNILKWTLLEQGGGVTPRKQKKVYQ